MKLKKHIAIKARYIKNGIELAKLTLVSYIMVFACKVTEKAYDYIMNYEFD